MTSSADVFRKLTDELGYAEAGGLLSCDKEQSGQRGAIIDRVRRHLPEISAVYFAENDPLAYFATEPSFDQSQLASLHRKVWNDSRVPLLFAIDASHVRVYDAWSEPTLEAGDVDDQARLIRILEATNVELDRLREFHRSRLDTGTYATDLTGRFDASHRCDANLLSNLEEVRNRLVEGRGKLSEDVAHRLLLRSILLLHLEHRGRLDSGTYGKYLKGSKTLSDVYADRDAAYRLFARVADRFNGDLLPVDRSEDSVKQAHLTTLRGFLDGKTVLKSGQRAFWPLYDFSVVPIQLISSVYERLLHVRDPDEAKRVGAYFTPYPLVELVMNEVLPWPPGHERRSNRLPRVLDPACGSGVFLVEAFRRLVAHWRTQHPGVQPNCEELSDLLESHIYGIDSDETGLAVKVAAFSLYLVMLDELSSDQPVRFPRLTRVRPQSCANLINQDAFKQTEALPEFDLVVGNPPWKRGKLPAHIQKYCNLREHPVAGEIAQAFLWLAGDVAPKGQTALLGPSKWLFNREGPDVKFRRSFFAENHVEAIINLSALVSGENRLFTANAPATAVVFQRDRPDPPSPSIMYCVPRPAPRGTTPMGLIIDAADIKWLPREEAEESDYIWKAMYVGSWRDYRLLRRMQVSKEETIEALAERTPGWTAARGFQPGGDKTSDENEAAKRILEVPFIDTKQLHRFSAEMSGRELWLTDGFKRTGPKEIYDAPHVLIKEGVPDGRVCAAFVDRPCSFRDTVTGVNAPPEEDEQMKALTAYLNSSLATYYLFLTTGWGIDRRRLKKGEVLSLPASLLEDNQTVAELANLVDRYMRSESQQERQSVDKQIDAVVFQFFDVKDGERILIRDMLRTSIEYVHARKNAKSTGPPGGDDLAQYAESFADVFGGIVGATDQGLNWTVYDGSGPLRVVSFMLRAGCGSQRCRATQTLEAVLGELSSRLWQRDGVNVYRRRHVRVFEDSAVHIVKPAELRFWTPSAAFHDADEVLAQSLMDSN